MHNSLPLNGFKTSSETISLAVVFDVRLTQEVAILMSAYLSFLARQLPAESCHWFDPR
jgi:hypothetical protein